MAACCRANSILASNININPCLVRIPILGGLSTDTLVPILSQTKPPVDIPRVSNLFFLNCLYLCLNSLNV